MTGVPDDEYEHYRQVIEIMNRMQDVRLGELENNPRDSISKLLLGTKSCTSIGTADKKYRTEYSTPHLVTDNKHRTIGSKPKLDLVIDNKQQYDGPKFQLQSKIVNKHQVDESKPKLDSTIGNKHINTCKTI